MFNIYGPGASLELSSGCSHYLCIDCSYEYLEDLPCEECQGPVYWVDALCNCWEESTRDIVDMAGQWYAAQGGDGSAGVFVVGQGIGWTNSAGRFYIEEIGEILDAFTINGDYRLEFTWTDYGLTVRRWSHDEPTGGARFLCESVANELRAVQYV
jgi:hypothetical protein